MKKLLYEITHTTTYEYHGTGFWFAAPASTHATPQRQATLPGARGDDCSPARDRDFARDYFGNPTHFIGVDTPHQQLVINSRSRVAVVPVVIPDPAETPAWEAVRARCCADDHSAGARSL